MFRIHNSNYLKTARQTLEQLMGAQQIPSTAYASEIHGTVNEWKRKQPGLTAILPPSTAPCCRISLFGEEVGKRFIAHVVVLLNSPKGDDVDESKEWYASHVWIREGYNDNFFVYKNVEVAPFRSICWNHVEQVTAELSFIESA